ncbi:MAG: hypothetical protein WA945_10265 [Arcobacteraceae bacterium]
MKRILRLKNESEQLGKEIRKLFDKQLLKDKEIDLPKFKNIQFTFYDDESPYFDVSDSTLSNREGLTYDEKFKSLFKINSDYSISDQTDYFKGFQNYEEILEATKKWCVESEALEIKGEFTK